MSHPKICPFARGFLETCYKHGIDETAATVALFRETAKRAAARQPIGLNNPAVPMLMAIGRRKLVGDALP